MKYELSRQELSESKEIIFYNDRSSKIRHSSLHTILEEIELTKEETERLEKVLKWR